MAAREIGKLVDVHLRRVEPSESPGEYFQHFSLPAFDDSCQPVIELGSEIKSHKFLVPEGAVLLSRLNPRIPRVWLPGPVGRERQVASTEFLVMTPRPGLDRRYLKYLCLSSAVMGRMQETASGTSGSHQRARPADILGIKVDVPTPQEQLRIAHILGTLDDKIELNRRMSQTLEEMARALFKSWFVDFDPVRAKAQGRDAGLPRQLADLFPDHFVESELGPIPEGWPVVPFSETVSIASGGTPRTSEPGYWSGGIPWFSVVDSPAIGEVWVSRTQKTVSQAGIESSAACVNPKGTTILSARGTVGNVALAAMEMSFNQSCYGFPVRPGELGYFTYFATLRIVDVLQRRAHGSVFSTITRATLHGIAVTSVPKQVRAAFEALVEPLMERILASNLESEALVHSRNLLLDMLLAPGDRGDHEGGLRE